MFFAAVSTDSPFEVVDLVRVVERKKKNKRTKQNKQQQQLYASLRHTDAVRSRMKAVRGKLFSTAALSKQKRNSPVAIL